MSGARHSLYDSVLFTCFKLQQCWRLTGRRWPQAYRRATAHSPPPATLYTPLFLQRCCCYEQRSRPAASHFSLTFPHAPHCRCRFKDSLMA